MTREVCVGAICLWDGSEEGIPGCFEVSPYGLAKGRIAFRIVGMKTGVGASITELVKGTDQTFAIGAVRTEDDIVLTSN
jgi:hypothetical protein